MRLTDDEVALAREAVACKHWDLLPGMLMDQRGLRVRYEDGALRELFAGDLPVLSDAATVGCLLALVREVWGRYDIYVRPVWFIETGRIAGWVVTIDGENWRGTTEAAALVAALKAAP